MTEDAEAEGLCQVKAEEAIGEEGGQRRSGDNRWGDGE